MRCLKGERNTKNFRKNWKNTITETISKKKKNFLSSSSSCNYTVNTSFQIKSNFPFDKQNDYKMIWMNFFFWTKKKNKTSIHSNEWFGWMKKKRNKMELKVERKKNHFIFNRSIIWTLSSSSSIIIHSSIHFFHVMIGGFFYLILRPN